MKVDRRINVPLYMQVYEALLNRIKEGSYRNGELLPPERELSALFKVDRLTLRRALGMLATEGLVVKKAGLGTWVQTLPARPFQEVGSRRIAFLLPRSVNKIDRITEPFVSALFYRIEKELAPRGFQLSYLTLGEEEKLPGAVAENRVAGVLFVSQLPSALLGEARARGVIGVVVNYRDEYFPSILPDREVGSWEAVNHLIGLGHRKIAYISGIPAYLSSQTSYQGYRRALVDAEIDCGKQLVREGDFTFDGGYRAMKSILEEVEELPSAVFACNDMTALGAIEAIREAGLRVPRDISVVGSDNVEQASQSNPRLTTVNMDAELMALAACHKLLFALESGQNLSVKIIVPARLIVRESTAAPRGGRGRSASGKEVMSSSANRQ